MECTEKVKSQLVVAKRALCTRAVRMMLGLPRLSGGFVRLRLGCWAALGVTD